MVDLERGISPDNITTDGQGRVVIRHENSTRAELIGLRKNALLYTMGQEPTEGDLNKVRRHLHTTLTSGLGDVQVTRIVFNGGISEIYSRSSEDQKGFGEYRLDFYKDEKVLWERFGIVPNQHYASPIREYDGD
jgi:hypothetical protein